MNHPKRMLILVLALISNFSYAWCQDQVPLTDTEKKEVVDSVSQLLNNNYVFPEVAKEMTALIRQNLKKGAYQNVTSPDQFANKLTEDLRSICKDKHLRVSFAPEQIAMMRAHREEEGTPEEYIASMRRNNFGFHEMKIMEGNVGYLDLRGFNDTRFAGEDCRSSNEFSV